MKFEQVVTVRASSIVSKLADSGFLPVIGNEEEKDVTFNDLFKPEEIVIGSRHWIEKDENFLQLIPACVFRKPDGSIFVYQRTKGAGETRLLNDHSVCVGGHLNYVDCESLHDLKGATNTIDVIGSVWDGIFREIREELNTELDTICDIDYENIYSEFKGVIYDNNNSVGRVHIGLLFVFDVPEDCEFTVNADEGMLHVGWYRPTTILSHSEDLGVIKLENWAKIVLEYLA